MHRTTALPIPLPRLPVRRWLQRARRSTIAWWLAAAAVAGLAATRVVALDDDVEARRQAWGEARPVVVATRALGPGERLDAGAVTVEQWPAAMVPDGALEAVDGDRVVTSPVVAGEAVVRARVAPGGLSGVAALVPSGHRAVAIPAASGGGLGVESPPLAVGDRVDVLATFDVLDGDAPPTAAVARDAVVVDVGDSAVTVAVDEQDATRVAFAVARGTATLALIGAG